MFFWLIIIGGIILGIGMYKNSPIKAWMDNNDAMARERRELARKSKNTK